ncbi:MAG: hypothetical protein AB7V50_08775 [Vampirovibrionia bacterium]
MDSISNNVAKNQMTFGLVTQTNVFEKTKESSTSGNNNPRLPVTQQNPNSIFDSFNIMNEYLEKQEAAQKEAKLFDKKQTPEKLTQKNQTTEELLSSSIFNKKFSSQKEKTKDNAPLFNVFSLFKPGEILESVSKENKDEKTPFKSY